MQGLRFRGVGGRDTGSRDGANFATGLTKKKGWSWLGGRGVREAGQGLGGVGCKGFGSGGVSGRGTGPRDGATFATCVVFLSFFNVYKKKKNVFF